MKPKLPASAISLLATTFITTSSALNLQNFQEVNLGSVPLACLSAYDTSIPSCTVADFGSGHFCSTSCISALTTLQVEITTACHGVTVSSSTLLGMVFESQLVNAICSVASSSSTTAVATKSTTSTSTSSTATSTASQTTAEASSEQTTTTHHSTSTSTTTTTIHSSTSLSLTLSTFTSTISSTTVSSTSSTSLSSISSLSVTTALTSTSTSAEPKATSSKNNGLTSEQMEQLLAMKHSGGGSPFDIFVSPGTRIGVASGVFMIVVVGWMGVWAL